MGKNGSEDLFNNSFSSVLSALKPWIKAARLRTLPLSLSGIIVGSFIAASRNVFDEWICFLAMLTTIGFQVLSNFANDYGDGMKGTDNEDRIGPERALQSGEISPRAMLNGVKVAGIITFLIAVLLIYRSFGQDKLIYSLIFLVLGLSSIAAAIKYTMGNKAYGYRGYGDFFVFIFFGLLSVCGSYFLYGQSMDYSVFLPAFSIGFLSVGVLNLNNMRDSVSDEKSK